MKLRPHSVGLILGVFMALLHALWSALVYLGVAKSFLDWISDLYLVTNPFKILSFNLVTTLILIGVTFISGYLMGFVFAVIANYLHKGK